jgi:hypothetical protein
MQSTAQAMQAYVRGLAQAPSHEKTFKEMVALPYLPIQPGHPTLGEAYVDLDTSTSKKRPRKSDKAGGDDEEKPKKKKKEKDPNAPKRPASGFIMYQNSRRAAIKEQHPEMTYKELMAIISDDWKNLGSVEKEVRLRQGTCLMTDLANLF